MTVGSLVWWYVTKGPYWLVDAKKIEENSPRLFIQRKAIEEVKSNQQVQEGTPEFDAAVQSAMKVQNAGAVGKANRLR